MTNLVVDISKYLMIFSIMLYTYFNFRYFGIKDVEKQNKVCRKQRAMMYLLHFLGYLVLYLKTASEAVAVFYLVQLVFFAAYKGIMCILYKKCSRLLLNNMCVLLISGMIILTRMSMERAVRQFVIIAASAVVTLIVPCIIDRVWQISKIPWIYAGAGVVFLFIVCIAGTSSFGARLSLNINGLSFQPSELIKISFVFFIAAMFYRDNSFKTIVKITAVAAAHVLLLVFSRDLGSAFIFFTAYLFMVFAATSNWIYFLTGVLGGSGGAVIAYHIFWHVRVRVLAWQNPWSDIDNRGYQITQSLFAMGTGGWFGMGLYQGMPGKIPVVENDFIFAAVSEEMGALFAACLILICLGCFLQFVMLAGKMQAVFYKLIAFGLGTVYITQVFLSVGGVTKFIPSTGVTLPFLSYGGSSLFSTFIMFGIIQGMYILKKNEEEEYE